MWRRLCDGLTASWLDEIRGLRADEDGFEASLDIWSVALTAELKDPQRREVAAAVLGRLQQLSDAADG